MLDFCFVFFYFFYFVRKDIKWWHTTEGIQDWWKELCGGYGNQGELYWYLLFHSSTFNIIMCRGTKALVFVISHFPQYSLPPTCFLLCRLAPTTVVLPYQLWVVHYLLLFLSYLPPPKPKASSSHPAHAEATEPAPGPSPPSQTKVDEVETDAQDAGATAGSPSTEWVAAIIIALREGPISWAFPTHLNYGNFARTLLRYLCETDEVLKTRSDKTWL